MALYGNSVQVDLTSANIKEAFKLNFNPSNLSYRKRCMLRLELKDAEGRMISENFYWLN